MPLNVAGLKGGLRGCFSTPPSTVQGCARAWADAMVAYSAGVVPPSTTVTAAGDALSSALVTAFEAPSAAPAMEVAFSQFAVSVGLGMAPTYAAVPPAAPVGFGPQFAGPKPETHADAAEAIGSLIDLWMRTGVSTLVAPPNTPQPWT